jgi:hypothetical protein
MAAITVIVIAVIPIRLLAPIGLLAVVGLLRLVVGRWRIVSRRIRPGRKYTLTDERRSLRGRGKSLLRKLCRGRLAKPCLRQSCQAQRTQQHQPAAPGQEAVIDQQAAIE